MTALNYFYVCMTFVVGVIAFRALLKGHLAVSIVAGFLMLTGVFLSLSDFKAKSNETTKPSLSSAAITAQKLLRGESAHLTFYSDLSMMQEVAVHELGLTVTNAQRFFSHSNMAIKLVIAPTNNVIATNK